MPKTFFPDRLFILKRGVLLFSVLLLSASDFVVPEKTPQVTAYYSSFVEAVAPVSTKHTEIAPVVKSGYYAVLAEEIHEQPVPTPMPTSPWGKSRQVDEHTWTIDVGEDDHYATAQEIAAALNVYRNQKGRRSLSWDQKLAAYAQSRASSFDTARKLDGHAGFDDYIHQQDGFTKLGFNGLGENSSIGYKLIGAHLIEWVYAGDVPHDDNQLSNQWTHVGVGASGDATDLVFGGDKQ
jgi:uncharacterized protein YkwD